MRRDLMGYGLNPPRIAWPNGAKLAVSIVVNYEEGAEMAVEAGDPENERIGEVISVVPPGRRDFGQEGIFSYGMRAGLPRFLEAFDRHGVKVSFFMCGRAVERTPELARECVARGHEAANHGWVWRPHADYTSREEEEAGLLRATEAIEKATVERPVGFFCRGSQSPWTRELLCAHGYTNDSDAFDDDLPFWDREVAGGPLLILPYGLDCNDMKFFHPNGFVVPQQFVDYAKAAMDQLIAEGERGVPKLLNIGLHLRICGRPARFAAVEGILKLLEARRGEVWVARRRDIAAHVRDVLPA